MILLCQRILETRQISLLFSPALFTIPLIICEINTNLNWSKNCIVLANNADQATTFCNFINSWNKLTRKKTERPNQYLDYLIDPSFQEVNRIFVLSFKDEVQ